MKIVRRRTIAPISPTVDKKERVIVDARWSRYKDFRTKRLYVRVHSLRRPFNYEVIGTVFRFRKCFERDNYYASDEYSSVLCSRSSRRHAFNRKKVF